MLRLLDARLMLCTLLLSFPSGGMCESSDAPKGFLGIEWGEDIESARLKMLKRQGVVFDTAIIDQGHQRLLFQLGTFLDEPVDTWNLEFIKGRFFWVKVILDTENFDEIESVLDMKYGTPDVSSAGMKEWRFPEATVRFIANSPQGHTSVIFQNNKLFNSKARQDEKESKIRLLDRLKDLE
jgi:hypothetical protein